MGGCPRASAFPPSSRGATRRPPPGSKGPRLLKAPPADGEGAASLSKVVAPAPRGAFGAHAGDEAAPGRRRPPIGLRAPSLPLSPPCGHSHGGIGLWFGRKVEVCVCVTGVSGVALLISKERSMHAATRTIALVLVMLGLGSAPLSAQANPPPAQANPPPPPVQANPPPPPAQANPPPPPAQANPPPPPAQASPGPPSGPAAQGPQYSSNEIVDAGHRFFGTISRGLAQIVEKAGSQFGLPNGYVLGQEAGGAVVAGLRYGEGILYTKNAGDLRVF